MKLKQRVLTSVLHDVKAFDHFHFSFVMFSLISSVNSLQAPRVTVCLCICGFRAQFLQSKGYFSDRKQTKSVSFPFFFFLSQGPIRNVCLIYCFESCTWLIDGYKKD